MRIDTGAQEGERLCPVAPRCRIEELDQFLLGHRRREIEKSLQPQAGGNAGKQLFDRVDSDLGQHSLSVGRGIRDVTQPLPPRP